MTGIVIDLFAGAPRRDQKRRDLAWVVEKWARESRDPLPLLAMGGE